MEILITGANGFLGKFIFKGLSNKHNLKCLSRTSIDYKVLLEREVPHFKQKFNLVIHAAGKAHSIPTTEEEKKQFYDVNVIGTLNLLQGLEQGGVPDQFVFISSVSVYGKEEGKLIDENSILEAKDPYGLSKIAGEKLIIDWCQKNHVVCAILRLPLLVGENPPGNLGSMIKAIVKGYYFNIGGGIAKKSMVLAEDVASFIPIVASIGGVYNLTDGYHPTFYELSTAIVKQKNKKLSFNMPLSVAKFCSYVGDFLGSTAPLNTQKLKKITSDLTFDDTQARQVVGWKPQRVLTYLARNSI